LDEALIQWSGSSSAYRLFFNRPGILENCLSNFWAILLTLIISALSAVASVWFLQFRNKAVTEWDQAHQMCQTMIGLFHSYARHGVFNARRILALSKDGLRGHKTMLTKQIYDSRMLDEQLTTLYKLFHPDVIFKVLHVHLLTRNFNLEVNGLIELKDGTVEEIERALFERNIRIALASDAMQQAFKKLLERHSQKGNGFRGWFLNQFGRYSYAIVHNSTKYMDDETISPQFSEFDKVTFDQVLEIADKCTKPAQTTTAEHTVQRSDLYKFLADANEKITSLL
jgi:hypothetical protein